MVVHVRLKREIVMTIYYKETIIHPYGTGCEPLPFFSDDNCGSIVVPWTVVDRLAISRSVYT